MQDQQQKPAFPILWIAGTILLIIGLLWYITKLRNDIDTGEAKQEKRAIEKKIDSINHGSEKQIEHLKKTANVSAEKSTNLIKSLPNEKTIVPDTAFAAMCKYIAEYQYTE